MDGESNVTNEMAEELGKETHTIMSYFEKIDWQGLAVGFVVTAFKILFACLVIFIAYRILQSVLNAFFNRKEKNEGDDGLEGRYITLKKVSHNILKAIAIFIAVYTVLSLMGIPVGTLLAGAGVVGLAVSFGAQGFVNDLINGARIIFEEQMHVGDHVVLESSEKIEGIVQNVGIQTTIIRGFDGVIHFVPNREIIIVSNKSRSSLRVLIQLPLYPESDLDLVRKVMEQVNEDLLTRHSDSITDPAESVSFVPYSNGQVAAQVIMYTHPDDMFTVRNDAFESYVAALTQAGVDLPNYTLTSMAQ